MAKERQEEEKKGHVMQQVATRPAVGVISRGDGSELFLLCEDGILAGQAAVQGLVEFGTEGDCLHLVELALVDLVALALEPAVGEAEEGVVECEQKGRRLGGVWCRRERHVGGFQGRGHEGEGVGVVRKTRGGVGAWFGFGVAKERLESGCKWEKDAWGGG